MYLQITKSAFVASIILLISAQFYISNAYARTADAENESGIVNFASDADRPIAGRNRRNIAPHSSNRRYPHASNDLVRVSTQVSKVRINVLSNDLGDRIKIKEVNTQSAKGGRVYYEGRYVVYSPKEGFQGWDSFWYAIVDANGHRHSAKVSVCICNM